MSSRNRRTGYTPLCVVVVTLLSKNEIHGTAAQFPRPAEPLTFTSGRAAKRGAFGYSVNQGTQCSLDRVIPSVRV